MKNIVTPLQNINKYKNRDNLIIEGGEIELPFVKFKNYGVINNEYGMSDKERTIHRKNQRKKKYGL